MSNFRVFRTKKKITCSTLYLENNCVDDPVKLCDFQLLENRIMKTVDSVYQVNNFDLQYKNKIECLIIHTHVLFDALKYQIMMKTASLFPISCKEMNILFTYIISTVKEIAKKTINYKDISAKNSYSNSRTFVMSAKIIVALF